MKKLIRLSSFIATAMLFLAFAFIIASPAQAQVASSTIISIDPSSPATSTVSAINNSVSGLPILTFDVVASQATTFLNSFTIPIYHTNGALLSEAYLYQGSTLIATTSVGATSAESGVSFQINLPNYLPNYNVIYGFPLVAGTSVPFTVKVDMSGIASSSVITTSISAVGEKAPYYWPVYMLNGLNQSIPVTGSAQGSAITVMKISTSTQPVITSISPAVSPAGSTITVYGNGFDTSSRTNNGIQWDSQNQIGYATAPSPDGKSLTFNVPYLSTGPHTVTIYVYETAVYDWVKGNTYPFTIASTTSTQIAPPIFSLSGTPTIIQQVAQSDQFGNATDTYASTFNVEVSASNTSVVFGLPNSANPAFPINGKGGGSWTIYQNGVASSLNYNPVVTYSQPANTILSSDGKSFTVAPDQTVTIPVTLTFAVRNPGANAYGVGMNGIWWSEPTATTTSMFTSETGWATPNVPSGGGTSSSTQPSVSIYYPTASSTFIVGSSIQLGFSSSNPLATFDVQLGGKAYGYDYGNVNPPEVGTLLNFKVPSDALPTNYTSLSGYTFQIYYNGSFVAVSPSFTIISATSTQPRIIVASPTASSTFSSPTSTIPFSWSWSGVNISNVAPVAYLLDQNGNTVYGELGLTYSAQGGNGVIPAPVNLVIPVGIASYRIEVCSSIGNNCGYSSYFTINKTASSTIGLYPNASISVISPKNGEILQTGTQYTIRWNVTGLPSGATQYVMITNGTTGTISDPNTTIVSGLPASVNSYTWTVSSNNGWGVGMTSIGERIAELLGVKKAFAASNQYIIEVGADFSGITGDIAEGKSGIFTITSGTSTSTPQSPTIVGAAFPTMLTVGQQGTWSVSASDPQNGTLSYSVNWGDNGPTAKAVVQTTTFTHSYTAVGTYKVVFTVTDSAGLSANTSGTVQVTSAQPTIASISPSSGAIGTGVDISGNGLSPNSQVSFSQNGTQVVVMVPRSAASKQILFNVYGVNPGTYQVSVFDPATKVSSNSVTFTVPATAPIQNTGSAPAPSQNPYSSPNPSPSPSQSGSPSSSPQSMRYVNTVQPAASTQSSWQSFLHFLGL